MRAADDREPVLPAEDRQSSSAQKPEPEEQPAAGAAPPVAPAPAEDQAKAAGQVHVEPPAPGDAPDAAARAASASTAEPAAPDAAQPQLPLRESAAAHTREPIREPEADEAAVLATSRRHTRRSFAVAAASVAAGYGLYRWLDRGPEDGMQPALVRRVWQLDNALTEAENRNRVLTPTYPLSRAETLRVNGLYGVKTALVPESWRLQFVGVADARQQPRFVEDVTAWEYRYADTLAGEDPGHDSKLDPARKAKVSSADKMAPAAAVPQAEREEDTNHTGRKPRGLGEAGESRSTLRPGTPGLLLSMEDLLRFPRQELVTEFKCIEGWSQIVHWAGVRLRDVLEAYPPAPVNGREPRYVYMETPDGDYYTGYELQACRHPQALLVTEMMGAPLQQLHGAPLRLHMPTKYGYKQIKRIGLISYTDDKPDDYWTKLGYDWYGGL